MNREEYLQELWGRLSNKLPAKELERVVAYYSDYFDEAGPGREAEIMAELGTPERLAREILGEREIRGLERGEGYHGPGTVWTILLAILAAPIAIPLMLGIFALALALIVCAFAMVLAFGVAGAGCIAGGAFLALCGLKVIFTSGVATTIYFVGGGLLAAGIGVFLLAATVCLFGLCCTWIAKLLGRAFRRNVGEVQA